jgi:hypothetical protein
MSVTANDVLNIVFALGDDLDDNGVPDDVEDLKVRTPGILTALQAELLRSGDIFSTYEIANKPATNMLGYSSGHDYAEFVGEDIMRECPGSAKAYYFEVSDDAVVYVEDYTGSWNILETVTCTPTASGYTAYKAKVTPTAGATKSRLRFSGTNRYIFTNYALFKESYATDDDVPQYRPWIKHELPDDFKSIDQVINEYPQRQYSKDANYKFEGKRDFYINYYYEGNIRIVYRPVPAQITSLTNTLQVDDVTARSVLPWALAMELYKSDETKFKYFQSRYREMKVLSMLKQPASEQLITNIYGPI